MIHLHNYKNIISGIALILLFANTGCKKFLDEKPRKSYTIPEKIEDLQALLDFHPVMNSKDVSAGEISANDYYLTDAHWSGLSSDYFRRMYIWDKENLFTSQVNDWYYSYAKVYTANTALDELEKFNDERGSAGWNNVKGQALVFRAKSFLEIAAVWTLAYDANTAKTDLGIPIRLSSNFNDISKRSSVHDTYERIINDLKMAVPLLPVKAASLTRPSKTSAYALLARTYLYMRKYKEAGLYADSCLQLNDKLLDYNMLSAAVPYPVPMLNDEVILKSNIALFAPLSASRAKIDLDLYHSYVDGDLRKLVFFKDNNNGSYAFKGTYEGGLSVFSGLATDEIYLIRAECYARAGAILKSMDDLNTLMINRWDKAKTFIPYTSGDKDEALRLILTERRKELLMRGLRWMDIKRLNKEGANIVMTRIVGGVTYKMSANDLRYALPIPEDVIEISGMRQNLK